MKKKSKTKRRILYLVFVILTVTIISLFVYFIIRFSSRDSNKYDVSKNSVLYTSSSSYTKVIGNAYISQRLDGYYYLNDNYDNSTKVTKIAKTAISNNDDEPELFIYGTAYQVDKEGEVTIVSGKTEVTKSFPTKFYKIDDRKYLFVDNTITSSDGTINTNGYLIIDLDKIGNASFSNNNLNIKTIKPLSIKGSTFEFDIANELLIYDNKNIDLKKILGSTNNFNENDGSSESSDNSSNNGNNENSGGGSGGDASYYDDYFDKIISSVNNLSNSLNGVNENSKGTVKKDEIYFDFSKWVAIKSVSSSINSITVNYQIFDPNNEYQTIYLDVVDNDGNSNIVYLNKNDTNCIIRDLDFGQSYTLTLNYQSVGDSTVIKDDTITLTTKIPIINLEVTQITTDRIYYNLVTENLKLDGGHICLYNEDELVDTGEIDVDQAYSDSGYTGSFSKSNLDGNIIIVLENATYNGKPVNVDVYSKIIK